jgi:hypothetical protein
MGEIRQAFRKEFLTVGPLSPRLMVAAHARTDWESSRRPLEAGRDRQPG